MYFILCKLTQRIISFQLSLKNTRDHLIIKPRSSSFPAGLGGVKGVGGVNIGILAGKVRFKEYVFVIHAAAKLVEGSPRLWKVRHLNPGRDLKVVTVPTPCSSTGVNIMSPRGDLINGWSVSQRPLIIQSLKGYECQNRFKFAALRQQ